MGWGKGEEQMWGKVVEVKNKKPTLYLSCCHSYVEDQICLLGDYVFFFLIYLFKIALFINADYLAFKTPDDGDFLVFGVSNAKYLAFDTPDGNVLYIYLIKYVIFLSFFFYRRNMLFS